MKKLVSLAITASLSLSAMAQDAYDAANLASQDLNGTARYVGMGGALDALGADISTISSNPAGIGLFRSSMGSFTLSVVNQEDAVKFQSANPTNLSFDQIGFVWSNEGYDSYLNFGFNFHKSRNFNHILTAANAFRPSDIKTDGTGNITSLVGGGQNIATDIKRNSGLFDSGNQDANGVNYYESQLDNLYFNLLWFDNGDGTSSYYPLTASDFNFRKGNTGYIGVYDLNISGNSNNRVYWGLTVGIHDVHYESATRYTETLEPGQKLPNGIIPSEAGIIDERTIKGQGVDLKAGIIFRPIAESPFRIGISIATPTWYDLKTRNFTTCFVDERRNNGEEYNFKYYTPWKFGLSLGHTIGNMLALGAGYEFQDFSSADMRYITEKHYDGDDSRSDEDMNSEIGYCLKGTHTLRLGAELKPDPALAVRLGYNFVSSQYGDNNDAYRNQEVYSPGVYYASTSDYTNWKATHRITAGLGTRIGDLSLDLAYQYSVTNGDFFPYADGQYYKNNTFYEEVTCPSTPVSLKRHQVLFTMGYRF